MTSKACFSKPAGFFRQLTAKQLWLFALWSVFLLFLYPLSGMMEFSDGWEYTALYDLQRHVDRSFLTRTTAVLYMMPVLAIVFSSCFGYHNSRQKLDFYHAQPVTRTRLFFTNYASGAFHFVVPYLVMHTLAFVLMNSVTGFYQPELRLLLYPMLYTLGMFFIFYSLMVLFRMVCGNTVIAVLSYGFMTNLPAIAYFLYQVYVGRWSNLYMSSAATESGMRLTPYTLLGSPMSVKVEPSGAYAFVTDIDWTALVVWVVAALAAAAGAVLLYKVRPSEKAGSAVAVRGVLPVIKYPLVVCASLLGGIFFAASTGHAFVWEIIGYLLFGLLAFMFVNVLEKFDFKNVLHGLWKIHPCFAAVGLFVGAGALGAYRNDEIPAPERVERVHLQHFVLELDGKTQVQLHSASVVLDDPQTIRALVELLGRYDFHGDGREIPGAGNGDNYCRMDVWLDTGLFSDYKRIAFVPSDSDVQALYRLLTEGNMLEDAFAYDFSAADMIYIEYSTADDLKDISFGPPYAAGLLDALTESYRESWQISTNSDVYLQVHTNDGYIFSCDDSSALYRWLIENGYFTE